jgi:hypothetical protein
MTGFGYNINGFGSFTSRGVRELAFHGYDAAADDITTFTDAPIGDAHADRFVIVAVTANASSGPSSDVGVGIASITIGGSTATVAAEHVLTAGNGYLPFSQIAYLKVPSGTTATVVTTGDNTTLLLTIAVYSVVSPTGNIFVTASDETTAADATNTTLPFAALTTTSDGFVVACAQSRNGLTMSSSNMTEDWEIELNSNEWGGAYSALTTGADFTPNITRGAGTLTRAEDWTGVAASFSWTE